MKKFLLALLIIPLLYSCNDSGSKSDEINPEFTSYISGFTTGTISARSDIFIRLASELPPELREKATDLKLLELSPAVKGSYSWIDKRTLQFTPDKPLAPGTSFSASFQLQKLLEVPVHLKVFEFGFQTIRQAIFVEIKGLESVSETNLEKQELSGYLRTADYAQGTELKQVLVASQDGNELDIRWTHGIDGKLHEFTVENISRTETKGELVLSWNGKSIGTEDKGEKLVEIPALGDFKMMKVLLTQQPDQYASIYFSDPIDQDQELRGLVYLESGEEITTEREGSQITIYPKNRLSGPRTLVINRSLRNSQGYTLQESYRKEILFSSIKPAVELVGDGVIIPGSDGLVLPFKAVNLKAVNVKVVKIFENNISQFFQANQFDGESQMTRVGRIIFKKEIPLSSEKAIDYNNWNIFSLDLTELMESEPGAIYRVSMSFDRSQSLYPCPGEEEAETEPFKDDPDAARYDGPYQGYYYSDYVYHDDYNWRERDDPCKNSYYYHRQNQNSASRNIFASELGIIAKGGDGSDLLVAVTNLNSSDPLQGINLELYNYQHQLLTSIQTDKEGMAWIPLESKPFLLVAKQGTQRGYLRLDDGSSLSTSMFDVSGMKAPGGIKGHIYGERGVWRPGDSIFISFVLEDKHGVLPTNHPLHFELYTPENQLYLKMIKTSGLNGVYDFRTATRGDAPTGNWLARVAVGGSSFTRTIRIETVKPNRLKINLDFSSDILTANDPYGSLHASWLHGAKAGNLKADIEMNLRSGSTKFKDFDSYTFDDPSKSFESEKEIIFDDELDNEGKARFRTRIQVGNEAPGMLNVSLFTRVFEHSGDFSVDRFTTKYSPFKQYVGVRIPEGPGWNGALYSTEENLIPIVTLDESGRPVDIPNLLVEVYDVSWRWWWERDNYDNLASYVQNRSRHLIKSGRISTVNGKALYSLKFDEALWGRKLIRITDQRGGHSTGQTFYVSSRNYWDEAGQDQPGGAAMLQFSTDKSEYAVGEDIQINLPEISEGRILVSVESGSDILDAFWVKAPLSQPIKLEATGEMAPNIYLSISLIQPYLNSSNDRPIRMYGFQAVKVVNPDSRLNPRLKMPDVIAPEEKVSVDVSEEDGKAMTYTLAVVDEGLLDLTRFRTPDLWNTFYAREALGIHTWDMYKYVMGALKGDLAGLLAVGGDEFIKQEGKSNTNRFKPVVKFLGPFELKAGKRNSHSFTMPNYVGSVRTMVVASHQGAYGSVEETTPVRKPLMVLATLPRVAGPAETLTLPVTVFAMEEKVREVNVELESNDMFSIVGQAVKKVRFSEPGDKLVYFNLKVAEKVGEGQVTVKASSGREKASDKIDLMVGMPNPRISKVSTHMLRPGESQEMDYQSVGLAGTNRGMVEVSTLPSMSLEKRLDYLISYPHGCVEQITSSVFPQLYLNRFVELDSRQKTDIQGNVIEGINRLKAFQTSEGGLKYWPGHYSSVSEWGTNYAGHFMLEAKAQGYKLPVGFLDGWLKFQTRQARSWERSGSHFGSLRANESLQAYRLYTLALAKKPALGAMNRMREIRGLSVGASWSLAGAYVLSGRPEVAQDIVEGLTTEVGYYRELSYTYGSSVRDQAMILEVMSQMGQHQEATNLVRDLAGIMNSESWYSTQTTAFVLLSIGKFLGSQDAGGDMEFEYELNGSKQEKSTQLALSRIKLPYQGDRGGDLVLKNTGSRNLFVNMQLDGIPLEIESNDMSSDLRMEVKYLDMQERIIDPGNLVQGTDFMAEVSISHPGVRESYKEMALVQMFPAGWEIRNFRLDNIDPGIMKDRPVYQDIRDDRVYSYFNLAKGRSVTFRIMLNATYQGEFYLPAIQCEAMYDQSIQAVTAGRKVKVVSQP